MLIQLREIMEQVASAIGLDDALTALVQKTCIAMQADCCSVYLATSSNNFELMANYGESNSSIISCNLNEDLIKEVVAHEQLININSIQTNPLFNSRKVLQDNIFASVIAVPIIYQNSVSGVLALQSKTESFFTKEQESFLMTLTSQFAIILSFAKSQGRWTNKQTKIIYSGIAVSPGIAVAKAWLDESHLDMTGIIACENCHFEQELERLKKALMQADSEYKRLREYFNSELDADSLAVFDFLIHLVNDPLVEQDLKNKVQLGHSAEWAVKQVIEKYSSQFLQMSDPYLKERSYDIYELGNQLLRFLALNTNDIEKKLEQDFKSPVVLLAKELTASMLASIPRDKLAGVVTQAGAVNSHAAILIRALGIPAVMAVDFQLQKVNGKTVVVDGNQGELLVQPHRHLLANYRKLRREEKELKQIVAADFLLEPITVDGTRINLLLNADIISNNNKELVDAIDGIGLYRTEIPFLLQHSLPTEDEQYHQYLTVIDRFPNMRIVMRTLDVGGDKCLPYLSIDEDNPFLGWRGVRFTLDYPEIFGGQIRAMLRASVGRSKVEIMLPMVSDIEEIEQAIDIIRAAFDEVKEQMQKCQLEVQSPRIGVMIEVPSMIFLLPALRGRVDFVSVGSNDLTQYLLAVDRNNPKVAAVYQPLHPAVIFALKEIIDTCRAIDIDVSLCGELAGSTLGAIVLIGLGYRNLSMNMSNLAKIKYLIRRLDLNEIKIMTQKILNCYTTSEVLAHLEVFLKQNKLDAFIR